MTGRWSSSTRRASLPSNWRVIRERVLLRDGHMCQWPVEAGRCGLPANEVDHRVHRDDHRPVALWSLCKAHHQAKTQAEALASRVFQDRPAEPHPGLL